MKSPAHSTRLFRSLGSPWLIALAFFAGMSSSRAVTFTNDTTIGTGATSYEGAEINAAPAGFLRVQAGN